MKVIVQQGDVKAVTAEALIVNLFEGVSQPGGATGVIDKALDGAISELIASGDVTGKLGQTVVVYPRGAIQARRVIVVGLGPADQFDLEAVREVSAVAIRQARQVGATKAATIVHGGGIGGLEITEAVQAVTEGSLLALYEYDAPRAKPNESPAKMESLTIVEFDESKIGAIEAGIKAGQIIAESVYLARDLVNQPSNQLTPTALAEASRSLSNEVGLVCRILEEAEMRAQGMGALLAVTQGASQPAKFITMEHRPPQQLKTKQKPIVLVGKGVTFDTGGYSLKTREGMLTMKVDMAGAAAVIGTLRAVALLELPLHVIGLVPSVENVVSPEAYKPGEVFIAKNGVSIEIISTDAEGRMLLADALCYADTLQPKLVIDVATLTGAKMVALGSHLEALFSNDDDLSQRLLAVGRQVGEPLWRMPLAEVYDRQLKSQVADIKNSGGRQAGAITAARFLTNFIGDWPWAHLDIAGSATYSKCPEQTPRSYLTDGATGIAVRTLVEFLRRS